jgi:ubiquinone biosynthesis protein COQ4
MPGAVLDSTRRSHEAEVGDLLVLCDNDTARPAGDDMDRTAAPPRWRGRDWRGAFRALRTLIRDSERTDAVFDLIEALDRETDAGFVETFRQQPEGRRLLDDRPQLLPVLADRRALAQLPAGSLGRAYLDFVTAAGISAEGLVEADAGRRDRESWTRDEDIEYLNARGRDCHDLWHVLTGYGTDEAGEISVLAFTYGQYPSLGIGLIVATGALMGPWGGGFAWQRYLWRAWRRGRRARLDVARYEDWLPLPLSEARRLAAIDPPEVAHPDGIISANRSELQPAGA